MSKPQHPDPHRRGRSAALVISTLALLILAVVGPAAGAQTNSGGQGQPADSTPGPASGGPSNQSGTNTGGDGQAGNRSTPGQGGATGGGAGAPTSSDGGGGSTVAGLAVVGVLVLVGAGAFVASRQRRLDRVGAD
jgi:hypothetical protein